MPPALNAYGLLRRNWISLGASPPVISVAIVRIRCYRATTCQSDTSDNSGLPSRPAFFSPVDPEPLSISDGFASLLIDECSTHKPQSKASEPQPLHCSNSLTSHACHIVPAKFLDSTNEKKKVPRSAAGLRVAEKTQLDPASNGHRPIVHKPLTLIPCFVVTMPRLSYRVSYYASPNKMSKGLTECSPLFLELTSG